MLGTVIPVFCAVICMAFFTLLDLCVQILEVEEQWSAQQVIHVRMTGTLIICLTYLYARKTPHAPWGGPGIRRLLWLRGLGDYIGLSSGYLAPKYLPLGEGVTLYSLKPFPVMILCYLFLKERISTVQAGATVVSIFAVIMIAQPQLFGAHVPMDDSSVFATDGWLRFVGYVTGLTQTMTLAITTLIIRALGHRSTPMQTLTMYAALGATLPYFEIMYTRALPTFPHTTRGWCALIGVIPMGMGGQLCETYALQKMSGGLAVILSYTGIVFATLGQWTFYHDLPSLPAFIGMALICLAGWAAVVYPPAEDPETKPLVPAEQSARGQPEGYGAVGVDEREERDESREGFRRLVLDIFPRLEV